MPNPLSAARAAQLPPAGLEALAPLRTRPGVTVIESPGHAWVEWPPGDAEVVRHLLPVPGVRFFARRDDRWFPLGGSLPDFDRPPAGEAKSLDRAVIPAKVQPLPPPEQIGPPVPLRVVPDDRPRPTAALRTTTAALAEWAATATTAEMARLQAARSGDVVWLLGQGVPHLAGERFWGESVLVPLGFRPEPDWPPAALRECSGVAGDELLVLAPDAAEALPRSAFRPLTRAGARRAVTER
jgi:hypothetical protein